MKLLFKSLFILFLFVMLAFLVYYIVLYKEWEIINGIYIYMMCVLIVILYFLGKYFYKKYKEKMYIKNIIAQDSDKISILNIKETQKKLDKEWYASLNKLTTSLLGVKDDPVHALPWLLVIGNKASDKEPFFKNLELSSIVNDEFVKDESCLWYYLDNIILLSLSDKYINKGYDLKTSKEWEHLLSLVKNTRKKEPINGLLITVSIDDLIDSSIEKINQDTLLIKKRIDEITKKFEVIIPIYIVITKMDQIYGFNETQNYLISKNNNTIIGSTNINIDDSRNLVNDIKNSLSKISNTLYKVEEEAFFSRNSYFDKISYFNKEYKIISNKVNCFVTSIFKDTLYQYVPKFRGIYFLGDKYSESTIRLNSLGDKILGKNLNFNKEAITNLDTNNLIKEIIPQDRNMFSYIKIDKSSYYQVLISLLFTLILISWSVLSYKQNNKILNIIEKYQELRIVNNNFKINNEVLYQRFLYLKSIDSIYNDSFFARFGYKHSHRSIERIKIEFNKSFSHALLKKFDSSVEELVNDNNGNKDYSILIGHLIQDILIQDNILNNKESKIDDISYVQDILNLKVSDNFADEKFLKIYYYFLQKTNDKELLVNRMSIKKKHLFSLLKERNFKFHWLIDKSITKRKNIYLNSYWPDLNTESANKNLFVNSAYTLNGKKNIEEQLKNIKIIFNEEISTLDYSIKEFWNWYDDQFFYQWRYFIKNFNQAFNYYDYSVNRPMLLFSMFAEDNNAYKKLIIDFNKHLEIYKNKFTPPWTKEVSLLNNILVLTAKIGIKNKNTFLDNLELKHEEVKSKLNSKKNKEYSELFNDAILLNNYFISLSKLEFIDSSLTIELDKFFSKDKTSTKLNDVYERLIKLRYSLKDKISDFSYNLVKGPFDFIMHYLLNRQSCFLNEKWKSDVLLESGSIPRKDFNEELFSKNGILKQFINKNLKNYLSSSNGEFYEKKLLEGEYSLEFNKKFLNFINQSKKNTYIDKNEYNILLKAKPLKVNSESKILPYRSSLKIECLDKVFTFNNYNFKSEKYFNWKPSQCGTVEINVEFENAIVKRVYKNKNGFSDFLRDYRNGYKRIEINKNDFFYKKLNNNNVKWINVYFDISNINELLKVNKNIKINIPEEIATCKKGNIL